MSGAMRLRRLKARRGKFTANIHARIMCAKCGATEELFAHGAKAGNTLAAMRDALEDRSQWRYTPGRWCHDGLLLCYECFLHYHLPVVGKNSVLTKTHRDLVPLPLSIEQRQAKAHRAGARARRDFQNQPRFKQSSPGFYGSEHRCRCCGLTFLSRKEPDHCAYCEKGRCKEPGGHRGP